MKTTLTFVTDPLCSWCWATLPNVLTLRQQFQSEIHFELMMAGLQVGSSGQLNEFEMGRLNQVWHEVKTTTDIELSGIIPPDFIYHSEKICRALQAARLLKNEPPWRFFQALQHQFYVHGSNIRSDAVLSELAESCDINPTAMLKTMGTEACKAMTHAEFDTAKRLGANALPSLLLDKGSHPRLMSGGYVSYDYLVETLTNWLEDPSIQ